MIKNIRVNNILKNKYTIHNYQSVCTDYRQLNMLKQELQKYAVNKCQNELHDKKLEEYKIKEISDEWVRIVLCFCQEQYRDLNPIISKFQKRNKFI